MIRIAFLLLLSLAVSPARAEAQMANGRIADPAASVPLEEALARVRAATESYTSLDAAVADGYARNGGQCLANPPAGAMGFHHQNDALLDDRLELERPEMLVYERMPDGEYRLNGVEYIVPFSAWAQTKPAPAVMGHELKPAPSLGIWYRHVWIWRENPSGMFADWNPLVKC